MGARGVQGDVELERRWYTELPKWTHASKTLLCLICSAVGALSQSGLMLDERALRSIAPAIDQLNSVFNEVWLLVFVSDC